MWPHGFDKSNVFGATLKCDAMRGVINLKNIKIVAHFLTRGMSMHCKLLLYFCIIISESRGVAFFSWSKEKK